MVAWIGITLTSPFLSQQQQHHHHQKISARMAYQQELAVAKRAVVAASKLCQAVRQSMPSSMTKEDKSPVTIADYGSQAIICRMLKQTFPNDPVVAEEDASDLRVPAATGQAPLAHITRHVQHTLHDDTIQPADILNFINHGNGQVTTEGRFWTLDPIDGTKGFLRGDQYAICLALIENGQVKLGVLGCPVLCINNNENDDEGHLFTAIQGQGCFRESLSSSDHDDTPPVPVSVSAASTTMVQSFEASHGNHPAQQDGAAMLGLDKIIKMDSQAKYAMVASGQAALYLRLASHYKENIWDHAAGSLIVQEAGGVVTDRHGKPLEYGTDKKMLHNSGVVVSNGSLHAKALEILKQQEQS